MSLRPRPEVENLKACPHGGINYAEFGDLGLSPEAILDFSVCSNPYMPPPGTRRAMYSANIGQYPDSEATELRQRLSRTLGVPPGNIIAGSGTTELIRLIALAYFRQGDRILIPQPAFGEYEVACQLAGARTVKSRAAAKDNFALDMDETVNLIRRQKPRAVFICNPNNPTGQYLPRQKVGALLKVLGDGLLILDEAYVTFVDKAWPSADLISRSNVVILRSMTKDYGLAGLRLGYAIASEDIIACLRRVCPPWNVNDVAQKMGAAVLDCADYLEQTIRKVAGAKRYLIDRLARLGFQILPSDANFFLMKVNSARDFRAALLKHGIMVRDCTSFGLPEYVRIAPRTMPECRKLITTIAELERVGKI